MKDCFYSMIGIEIPGFTEDEEELMNKEGTYNVILLIFFLLTLKKK